MGKAAASAVAELLIANGLPPSTLAVMVENASLSTERIFTTKLDLLPLATAMALGNGPAILLIGQAMARQPAFDDAISLRDLARS